MNLPSTFSHQGWTIRYRLEEPQNAKNSPVVFVHGTPWSSVVFGPIIDALLARGSHQVLVYDLPGYGQSQAYQSPGGAETSNNQFEGDTSVKFQAGALTALLAHTKLDGSNGHAKASVVAHDIAGTIVLRTHLIHQVDFASMLLLDTNTVLPWGDGFYKLVRSQPQAFLELPPAIFEAVVRAVTRSACQDPKVLQAGWEDWLAEPWLGSREAQHSFVRQIAQANDQDVEEMLAQDMYARVRCDVKIIWGEADQWIPKHKIEALVDKLQGRAKEVVFVPDAGHLVMLDQPARVAIETFAWLNQF